MCRRGEAKSRGVTHAAQTADVAAAMAIRSNGADLLSRLLVDRQSGGWGFQAALTSTGKHMTTADQLHRFLLRMGNNGYWHQQVSTTHLSASRWRLVVLTLADLGALRRTFGLPGTLPRCAPGDA